MSVALEETGGCHSQLLDGLLVLAAEVRMSLICWGLLVSPEMIKTVIVSVRSQAQQGHKKEPF